ncbi:hypothetical protein AQ616_18885 [Oceanobacillus sp. E9]|uniref:phage tail protein n=1 Tax=Oceanobacillus sp. E9 TaxID=1742575 RepID=UPI00084E97A8|nr:hypothetical protein [Oceanobacillus sp. E9]OEH52971.1 hypothetical protein AQ616_18885 [Oceanobacillus sp. E9]
MSKRVKGITIEIEGETKGLDKALQDVNKRSRDVNSELRDVERLLKFNPGNTELLAQKQKLLGDQVETTRDRLDQLKGAQEEVERQFAEGEIGEEQYRNFQRELVETESKLAHFESQLEGTQEKTKTFSEKLDEGGQRFKDVGGKISDAGGTLTKFVTGPIAAGSAGLLGLAVNAGKTADRILDLSAITGLSTDSIQEWQHVATVAGVEQEALTNAVEGLIRKIPQLESEGGKATESLDKLGLSFSELENMTPDQQVDTLIKKLSELEDPMEANAIGSQLFGGAWKDIAPILSMGSDAIEDARNEAHDLGRVLSEDSLNDANNFRIELDKLIETFKAMFVQIGAKLTPLLQDTLVPLIRDQIVPAIVTFSEKVAEIIEWFTNLSPAMQGGILAFVGLLAVIGPVLVIIGKLAIGIGALMQLWATLGPVLAAISGPVGIVIGVIVGLIAIVTLLWTNWDTISKWLADSWEWLKETAVSVFNWIKEAIISEWEQLKEFTSTVWNGIKTVLSDTWDWIKTTAKNVFNWIKDAIVSEWNALKDFTSTIWNGIKSFITGLWNGIKSTASTVFNAIKSSISNVWNSIKNTTSSLWNGIKSTVTRIWDGMKSTVKNVFNGIKKTITGVWDTIKSKTDDIWTGITDSIKGAVNGVISVINGMINGLNNIKIKLPTVPDWVPGMGGKGGQTLGFSIPNIPSLDVGTNYVKKDGLAMIHEGEAVVPKKYNPAAGGGAGQQMVINPAPVYLDEQLIGEIILNIVDQRLSTQFSMNSYVKGDR